VSTESGGRRIEVHPGREVVVEFDPDRTFECVEECTWCCHHGVLLYDEDFRALADRANLRDATTTVRGERFVRKKRKDRECHVDEAGEACYFLREDGLCALQAEADDGWKPTRCWVFPLEVWREDGDLHVDVRDEAEEHCEGMDVTERRMIDHLADFLPEALWELDDPDTKRRL